MRKIAQIYINPILESNKGKIAQCVFLMILILVSFIAVKNKISGSGVGVISDITISDSTNQSDPIPIKNKILLDKLELKSGDNLSKILSRYNVSDYEIHKITALAKKQLNMSGLKLGHIFKIKYLSSSDGKRSFQSLTTNINSSTKLEIFSNAQSSYESKISTITFKKDIVKIDGSVSGNIVRSATSAGIPLKNILEVVNLYSHQIDFQRDVRDGDKFSILFEKFTPDDDNSNSYFGKTIYSSLSLRNNNYNIYRFKLSDNSEDFYDENYKSIKRSLLRTPVMATRISSKFGMRKHPILGYSHMHKGVDFAAPSGTPVYSAGGGTVTELGWKGAYGKYIRVKHNSEISTAYAHLKKFPKHLKRGSKVKQGEVIAYVGTTGRSSGPHLHYEVISNGVQINPLKIRSISPNELKGKDRALFAKYKLEIDKATKMGNYPKVLASFMNSNKIHS